MPDITLEVRRIPKPGKDFEVAQLVIEGVKGSTSRAVVTGSALTAHTGQRDIVSAFVLSSWDELEEIHHNFLTNEDFRNKVSEIDELCVKASTIQGLNVLVRGDFSGTPKYMRRNFLVAKRGESAAVADTLLEWREAFPVGKRPTVQRGAAGDIDMVRVTASYESLNALMEASADVATNPAYEKFRGQINRLTSRVNGYNSRILHVNQPQ
jgi:hypothetical protein